MADKGVDIALRSFPNRPVCKGHTNVEQHVVRTRKIPSLSIHVQQAIGQVKHDE